MAVAHKEMLSNLKAGETAFRAENDSFRMEVVMVGDGFSVCASAGGEEEREVMPEKKARKLIAAYHGNRFEMEDVQVNFFSEPYIIPDDHPSEAH